MQRSEDSQVSDDPLPMLRALLATMITVAWHRGHRGEYPSPLPAAGNPRPLLAAVWWDRTPRTGA